MRRRYNFGFPLEHQVTFNFLADSIEVPCFLKSNLLGDNFGLLVHRKVLEKYGDDMKKSYSTGELTPQYMVAVNQVFEELTDGKVRIATQADAERLRNLGREKNGLNYNVCATVFSGFVLRSVEGSNRELADRLRWEARNVGMVISEAPIVFWLKDLRQKKLGEYYLKEGTKPFYAEILGEDLIDKYGCFLTEDVDPETGLPTKLNPRGITRTLLNSRTGVCGLLSFLNTGQIFSDLDKFDALGKILLVSNEEAA